MGNRSPKIPPGRLNKLPVKSTTVERKKYFAEIMIFATVFKGKTLAEAWREAHPESKANDSTAKVNAHNEIEWYRYCLLYTSPSPRDRQKSRMPSSA